MRNHLFFLLFILSFLIFSCGENPDESESLVEVSNEASAVVRLKTQITNGLAASQDWTQEWERSIPLHSEGFEFVRMDTIQDLTMPERNPILKDDPLFPHQFEHPEGNGRMDLYSSRVEARRNSSEAFLNPDSKVIWYRNDGMKETLLFMGPSGMFEEGRWMSSQEFLVLGYLQEEEGYRPMAWLIDLEQDKLYQYAFSGLSKTYDPTSYLEKKLKNIDLR